MAGRRISILGSTGSIGCNTLDLIDSAGAENFQIVAITANQNAKLLAEQAIKYNAEFVALGSEDNAKELETLLSGHQIEIGIGPDALIEAGRRSADFIMAAIIGAAGLEPTLQAVAQGTHIGLANKECLVCAGDLFMAAIESSGAKLLPVDSEHNAIFQVLDCDKPKGVRRLILTASGGPFLNRPLNEMAGIMPKDALKHPIWSMGAKISIDSASMMNKGLELIEASYLFDRPSAEIDVVIHPQSIVHSMVEYIDGSVLAQMGSPDMKTPIAYAMAWPDRMQAPVERLDLTKTSSLSFFEPDLSRFPALGLAREALEAGGAAPNILNAANEIAVAAFLDEKIRFVDIPELVEQTLLAVKGHSSRQQTLNEVLVIDAAARRTATDLIKRLS